MAVETVTPGAVAIVGPDCLVSSVVTEPQQKGEVTVLVQTREVSESSEPPSEAEEEEEEEEKELEKTSSVPSPLQTPLKTESIVVKDSKQQDSVVLETNSPLRSSSAASPTTTTTQEEEASTTSTPSSEMRAVRDITGGATLNTDGILTKNKPLPTDSMVSISLDSSRNSDEITAPKALVDARIPQLPPTPSSPPQSAFKHPGLARTPTLKLVTDTDSIEDVEGPSTTNSSMILSDFPTTESPIQADSDFSSFEHNKRNNNNSNRDSMASISSLSDDVDWNELETKEDQTTRTEQEQEEQTAFLIARLERENSRLEKDPKSGIRRADTRPPSMHQLKLLMINPDPEKMRYSMLPSPPPLTDLDFYAALVADYPRCAAKLPFLLSKKIRAGIPPPLRGVVWISMAGARDATLETMYEQLLGETSPYEQLIGKDVGRTGLEMFRQEGGEGQQLLGRVLRAFSIYDAQIGYCQGLGFLVGPLLMHMNEKEAFCVLVRLMEHYDLRSCFTPNLYGLQLRMYQYQHLLQENFPELHQHFEDLGIQTTYAAQWFLSLFAVTCPLPILLRIYDVIFAEGAPETMMRVALSLMKRNQARLLAFTEFEDVMQHLLARGLWDTYNCTADDLMEDFLGLSGLVTRETLGELERRFKEETPETDASAKANRASKAQPSDLQTAAARFLGRLWGGSTPQLSLSLSPGSSNRKSTSDMMKRTNSKQSFTSTVSSYDSMQSDLSITTNATTVSRRNSGRSIMSTTASRKPNKDGELHAQIEDLLMVLGSLQKGQAEKEEELKKIKAEREEERVLTRKLLALLENGTNPTLDQEDSDEDGVTQINQICDALSAKLSVPTADDIPKTPLTAKRIEPTEASSEASRQLTEELQRTRKELDAESEKARDLGGKIEEQNAEIARLRKQCADIKSRWEITNRDKQRVEKQLSDFRLRKGSFNDEIPDSPPVHSGWEPQAPSGLREFRLGRAPSTASSKRAHLSSSSSTSTPATSTQTPTFAKRTSSLGLQSILSTSPSTPRPASIMSTHSTTTHEDPSAPSTEALLMELVQSKTAEAEAKQLAEEYKCKLDALKRQLRKASQSSVMSGAMPSPGLTPTGLTTFGGLRASQAQAQQVQVPVPVQSTGVFGGWGGWGKKG